MLISRETMQIFQLLELGGLLEANAGSRQGPQTPAFGGVRYIGRGGGVGWLAMSSCADRERYEDLLRLAGKNRATSAGSG